MNISFKGFSAPPTATMKAGASPDLSEKFLKETETLREPDFVEDGASIFSLIEKTLKGIAEALSSTETTDNAKKVKLGLDIII